MSLDELSVLPFKLRGRESVSFQTDDIFFHVISKVTLITKISCLVLYLQTWKTALTN